MISAAMVYQDEFARMYFWNFYDQIGEGEPVEVYAWPRFSFQFTGDNVGGCEMDLYGTHEGPQGSCWGLVATLKMPIRDRMHDPFVDVKDIPICKAYKPVLRGVVHPDNHNGVFFFGTRLFQSPPGV